MSLASYSDLKASIAEFANRSDITDLLLNDFISLAEAEFNNRLRCVEQETVADITVTSRRVALPVDCLEVRAVEHSASPVKALPFLTPEMLARKLKESGPPQFYSIIGQQIQVLPIQANATLTLTYWAKIPALNNAAPTNWLLTNHPHMYLWECMRQCSIWSKDDNAIIRYAELLSGAFDKLGRSDQGRRFGGTSLAMMSA